MHSILLCQGVGWCDTDVAECDSNLRCLDGSHVTLRNISTSEVAPHHHYCSYEEYLETNEYEHIDRSDEKNVTNTITLASTINYEHLGACLVDEHYEYPGENQFTNITIKM